MNIITKFRTDGVEFHFWQDAAGDWWTCRSGMLNGIYSESDDIGPFPNQRKAAAAQEEDYQAYLTNDDLK